MEAKPVTGPENNNFINSRKSECLDEKETLGIWFATE